MLATTPHYQGRGCGSRLVQWGLEHSNRDGIECFLEASAQGVSLYRKLGFVEVDNVKTELTLPDGSVENMKNLGMVRQPSSDTD